MSDKRKKYTEVIDGIKYEWYEGDDLKAVVK